jgi:lysozyme family protein
MKKPSRGFRQEGGFSSHPDDAGGKTRFSITEAVARANAYSGRMEDLPKELAETIAKNQYWDALRLDDISASACAGRRAASSVDSIAHR